MLNRNPATRKEYDRMVRSICQECTVGCGLIAYLKSGGIVDIHGDRDHPVSRGRLCARGIAFAQGLNSPERITCPAFRESSGAPFETLKGWETALDLCAERLRKIRDQHGPESIFIASDREAGLDFTIGAIRFAALLGTPHIYHPLGLPGNSSSSFLPFCYTPPCYEWEQSGCIFFIEADMALSHPVAFGRALDAQQKGAKIIAADARFTRTMSKADMALRIMPSTGNILGLALMKMILNQGLHQADITRTRFSEPEKWAASFEKAALEDMENITGLTAMKLRELSALLHQSGPAVIVTGKNLASLPGHGIWPTLAVAMGWDETTAGGWYPLDMQMPALDPYQGIAGDSAHKVPGSTGIDYHRFLTGLQEDSEKDGHTPRAMLCSGDCFRDFFSTFRDLAANTDLMALFGSFPNRTVSLSHMVFPSALWAERNSLCFSNDRAILWGEKIVEPSRECRSGLDFWCGLAKRFGWHDYFPWLREDGSTDHLAFYQWVLDGSRSTQGCRTDELRDPGHVGDLCIWSFKAQNGIDVKMDPVYASAAVESPVRALDREHYPLYFQRVPLVSSAGEASHWWPWTRELEPEDAVQINPETAKALAIENGEDILVSNSAGTLAARAWISRMVPRWMVSIPRDLEGQWVLVRKKEQTSEQALEIIREFLQ